MNTLGFGTVWNDKSSAVAHYGIGPQASTVETAWDITRARACVCDAGYDGINCANRMCPYGSDPLFVTAAQAVYLNQIQTITLAGPTFATKSFALKFTSRLNETFTTEAITVTAHDAANGPALLASTIQTALLKLPNKVIDGVTVGVTQGSATALTITVTFTGNANQGRQNLLELDTAPCPAGCAPSVTGITETLTTGTLEETEDGDFNSYECGRRGKCDYDTGLCACFNGFTGDNCNTITALI